MAMLEWGTDIRCHGLMSYYNISYNKLKEKKDFIGNGSQIKYDGYYEQNGKKYDKFTIYDDKEFKKQNYYETCRNWWRGCSSCQRRYCGYEIYSAYNFFEGTFGE